MKSINISKLIQIHPCQQMHRLHQLVCPMIATITSYIYFQIMNKRNLAQKQSPSRVLLICVYDTIVLNISNQTVYARFSPFGHILKILIFQHGEVTKFFLQYSDIPSAQQAKNYLDGGKLFESICKMNIYYSNFASVDLKHQTTEGVSLETPSLSTYPVAPYPTYPNYPHYPADPNYPVDPYTAFFQPFLQTPTLPLTFGQPWSPPAKSSSSHTACLSPDRQIERHLQSEVDWLLRSDQKKQNIQDPNSNACLAWGETNCYLGFALSGEVTNRQLYNLFSNFGNLSFIKKTRSNVYLKFRSCEFAAIARNYLTGYTLMESTLDLQYLREPKSAEPREDEYSQVTYFDPSFDRFTNSKSISINPPSRTLHVSSIRREACRADTLRDAFEEFGEVEGVEVLNCGSEKNMALVQFAYVEDSFRAIASMHGQTLNGRKIQISFTKSKLY